MDERRFREYFVDSPVLTVSSVFAMAREHGSATPELARRAKEIANFFVSRGISINAIDREGCTPLQRSVIDDDSNLQRYVLSKGASWSARGSPAASLERCRGTALDLAKAGR